MKKEIQKLKTAIKNRDPNLGKIAKKIWGEKGDRIIYSDKKHPIDIIYRYKWGYWKGKLQALILKDKWNKSQK